MRRQRTFMYPHVYIGTRPASCLSLLLALLLWPAAIVQAEDPPPATEAAAQETAAPDNSDNTTDEGNESPAGKDLPPRVLPDLPTVREHQLGEYLQLFQREREQVELVAAEQAFQGLLLTERSGNPQGGVLILHDQGQHGHWPDNVAPLREYLPDYGWTTLSISLPDIPPPARPPRSEPMAAEPPATAEDSAAETAADTAQQPDVETEQASTQEPIDSNGISVSNAPQPTDDEIADNEPALPRLTGLPPLPETVSAPATAPEEGPSAADRYREQMLERISAGVRHLNSLGQLNLVIVAHGHSAAWAVAWLNERRPDSKERGLTLVLIDALDNTYAPVLLDDALVQLEMPVLDLITPFNRNHRFTNQQREGRMKHKQRKEYQQIEIPGLSLREDYGNTVTRRVRGWLKTNAAGTELKTAGN